MAALPLLLATTQCQARSGADTILRGAHVYTLDTAQPWANAIAIRDGRIAYVGDDAGAIALRDARTRVIDLQGRMVLPGLHDSHMHPMSGGMRLLRCDLARVASAQDLLAAARACAARKLARAWVLGSGWSPQLVDASALQRASLDAIEPKRPVYLASEDGFTAWVNAPALALAGIDPQGVAPDIEGLARDPLTHRPTGIVSAAANDQLHQRIPKPTQLEYRDALRRASQLANSFGITSVFDAAASPQLLDAYRAADRQGELNVRIVAAQTIDPKGGAGQVETMIARRDAVRGTRVRADAAKIFLDGEIDMHTAAMLAPYARSSERGALRIDVQALDAIVARLDAAGFLIHMHAMGDAAVRAGLDAIERAERSNGARDRRHQLAHIGVADPEDIPRFGKLGVAANFSPLWFRADDSASVAIRAALGPQREQWNYPIASVMEHDGLVAASSDWPAPSMNPLLAMQAAMTRQPFDGSQPPLQPEQRVSLEAIIAAYTKNAAWLAREDQLDGSIEVGKAADLAVLDRNLFDIAPAQLRSVRVLLTFLDGRVVYRDPAFVMPRGRSARH